MDRLPHLITPTALNTALGAESKLLVIDLGNADRYPQQHIPGAVWLDYAEITRSDAPAAGLVATEENLSRVFSALGLTADTHVVAYDDAGNGKAARLCYTLDCIGHPHWSLLDGGLPAWLADGFATSNEVAEPEATDYQAQYADGVMWTADDILQQLHQDDFVTLDARSAAEYQGLEIKATHGGHIPGAAHYEWTRAMDNEQQKRLRDIDELRAELEAAGLTPDKQIVAYCQTHHRSAYSYVMLKYMGYPRVAGYPGAWSDWGNTETLPVEV